MVTLESIEKYDYNNCIGITLSFWKDGLGEVNIFFDEEDKVYIETSTLTKEEVIKLFQNVFLKVDYVNEIDIWGE